MFGEKGRVQIYTGNGKGKTTAALGLALRACGHGAKVVIIQFMKGWDSYGELYSAARLSGVSIIQTGRPDYVYRGNETQEDYDEAMRGIELAGKILSSDGCDLLILDEVNVALDYGLVRLDDVISLIRKRPENMELVLTGRNAVEELVKLADLVTEMVEIKHPYKNGIIARKGVEF